MYLMEIEQRLRTMQEELEQIKSQSGPPKEDVVTRLTEQIAELSEQIQALKQNQVPPVMDIPVQTHQKGLLHRSERVEPTPVHFVKPEKKDMEKFVGQFLMGILAAILLLTAMGIFGTMILPYLSISARMLLLYAVSIGLTLGGIRMGRGAHKRVAMTISGIGCGGCYLSIILSRLIWFSDWMYADLVMYPLLLFWCMILFILGRKSGWLFDAIAHVGIVIAFAIGIATISGFHYQLADPMILLLVLFLGIAEGISLFATNGRDFKFSFAAVSMVLCVMLFCINDIVNPNWNADMININPNSMNEYLYLQAARVLLFLLIAMVIVVCLKRKSDSYIQDGILSFGIWTAGSIAQTGNLSSFFSVLVVAMICYLLYDRIYAERRYAFLPIIAEIVVYRTLYMDSMGKNIAALVLLPIAVLAVVRQRKEVIGASIALLFGYAAVQLFGIGADSAYICLVLVITSLVLMWMAAKDSMLNCLLHGIAFLHVLMALQYGTRLLVDKMVFNMYGTDISYMTKEGIRMLAAGAVLTVCVILMRMLFPDSRKWDRDTGSAFLFCYHAVHVLSMGIAVLAVYLTQYTVGYHILAVINVLICFTYQCRQILRQKWGGVRVGLKGVIVCYAVLTTFHLPQYTTSIGFFILAITAIICGFRKQIPSFRMFGLVLSCLSVCKLMICDFHYDSSAIKAVCFLICGSICLCINLIYNHISEKGETA